MKLIDIKDTLPVGFIPIQETIDTRKLASVLQSHALGAAAPPVPVWSGGGGLCPRQGTLSALLLSGVTCACWGAALDCNETAFGFPVLFRLFHTAA